MTTNFTIAASPLDADTLQRLGELLDDNALASGGIPLEAADGLISAAVVSPGKPVQEAECLPLILGTEAWSSASAHAEAQRLVTLLWSDVARRVGSDPERTDDDLSPVIGVPPDFDEMSDQQIADSGYQMGSSWAFGFVLGADLRREEWEQRLERDEDLQADFYDIFALMPDEIFSDDELDDELDDDDIGDANESLDEAVEIDDEVDDGNEEDSELSHADRVEVIDALPTILFAMNKARLQELS